MESRKGGVVSYEQESEASEEYDEYEEYDMLGVCTRDHTRN
jgi:hypothetical protein